MIRKSALITLLGALAVAAGTSWAWGQSAIRSIRVAGSGAITDPRSALWAKAPATAVAMLPQTVLAPTHPNAAIKELRVRSLHNGQWIALLLEWDDPTHNDILRQGDFGDQVAVELPNNLAAGLPSPMMGNPGGRVTVMQWRAALQRDLEKGEIKVRDAYPFALVDVYPDQVLTVLDSRSYTGAVSLDNPVSRPMDTPVLDQMAEGWGTLTVKPAQQAKGHGIWEQGRWRVVITRPLHADTPNDPAMEVGGETMVAFAAWDGGNREVGARKAWSSWVALKIASE
jgi:hypothetical protein